MSLEELYHLAIIRRETLINVAHHLDISLPQKVWGFGGGWINVDLFTMGEIVEKLLNKVRISKIGDPKIHSMLEIRKDLNILTGIERPLTNISFNQLYEDLQNYCKDKGLLQ